MAVPDNSGAFYQRQAIADYRPEITKSWWLDLEVALDHATGRVLWSFRSLDPQTGELPTDALAGFLPPNDATGRGQGQVAFAIRPQPGTPDGTLITNSASMACLSLTRQGGYEISHQTDSRLFVLP